MPVELLEQKGLELTRLEIQLHEAEERCRELMGEGMGNGTGVGVGGGQTTATTASVEATVATVTAATAGTAGTAASAQGEDGASESPAGGKASSSLAAGHRVLERALGGSAREFSRALRAKEQVWVWGMSAGAGAWWVYECGYECASRVAGTAVVYAAVRGGKQQLKQPGARDACVCLYRCVRARVRACV